jgi:cyclase
VLGKRVIPSLLVKGKRLFKGKGFAAGERSIGHAAAAVRVHAQRGVDELCLLDITATAEGRGPDLALVMQLSSALFVPLTVGGGVRSCKDIDALLRAGADKVCIGAAAAELPDLVSEASARFGRQAIVVSIDVVDTDYGQSVSINCGQLTLGLQADDGLCALTPVDYAQAMEEQGAGEILLQSVDRDGTMTGYDLDLIREVSAATSIPVIASGGCGGYADMLAAIKAGADAVAAGAVFQFTDATPRGAAQFLRENGICARL